MLLADRLGGDSSALFFFGDLLSIAFVAELFWVIAPLLLCAWYMVTSAAAVVVPASNVFGVGLYPKTVHHLSS